MLKSNEIYCLKCKKKTPTLDVLIDKRTRKGKCQVCKAKKCTFISKLNEKLQQIYYDPKQGFCGVEQLSKKTSMPKNITQKFLDKQELYTKYKPARKIFNRRKVIVHGVDEQWQLDLVEMINESRINHGFRYILTCIDVFSKYAWAIPIKRKTGNYIVEAFTKVFKTRKPLKIQTDYGKEFFNKNVKQFLDKQRIHHFSTNSEMKACVIERFNRTLKEKLEKIFYEQGKRIWIDVLDNVIQNYNNTVHRSVKMTPIEASKKQNTSKVFQNLFNNYKECKPKFKIGETVRLRKYKGIFEKGYKQNFTSEIFKIIKVLKDINGLYYYHVEDLNGENVEGTFYAEDLCRFVDS